MELGKYQEYFVPSHIKCGHKISHCLAPSLLHLSQSAVKYEHTICFDKPEAFSIIKNILNNSSSCRFIFIVLLIVVECCRKLLSGSRI